MIYFTADTHFGHNNIRRYCNRPFDSTEEMNEVMISNWNSIVKKTDEVYHLGDVCWHLATITEVIPKLNGKIFLLLGNHDNHKMISALKMHCTILPQCYVLHLKEHFIVLSHYPLACWNQSRHGSYMLHGHMHGNIQQYSTRIDVGVDCFDFRPVSFDEILEKAKMFPKFQEPYSPK